jgi:hypothetical protein
MTETQYETHTVSRDNEPSLVFKGDALASVSSSPERALSGYSGETGRWCELIIYKTVAGKYVAEQVDYSQWEDEQTRHSATVCTTPDEVTSALGWGWLAKDLYFEATNLDPAFGSLGENVD